MGNQSARGRRRVGQQSARSARRSNRTSKEKTNNARGHAPYIGNRRLNPILKAASRTIALAYTATFALSPGIAWSDFGEADISKTSEFNAYCGKKGNNCSIRFEENQIVVNNKSRVNRNQILKYTNLSQCDGGCLGTTSCPLARHLYSIDIEYAKKDGTTSTARTMFVNARAYQDFLYTMKSFSGFASSGEVDPRCPSGGKLVDGNCLTTEQATQKRYQDALLWMKASEQLTDQQELETQRQQLELDRNRPTQQSPIIIIDR